LFCYGQSIIDFDAKIPDSAFDLVVTEQELNGPEIAGASVDQSCLGSPKRVGAEQARVEPDAGEPAGDEPCILARRYALADAASARE
jgi:hypothetical protein